MEKNELKATMEMSRASTEKRLAAVETLTKHTSNLNEVLITKFQFFILSKTILCVGDNSCSMIARKLLCNSFCHYNHLII